MKKLLVALLVAVLCVPAMADVTVGLVDNTDGTFGITLNTGGDVVRGLALKVDSAAASLVIHDDAIEEAAFNTCIDYAYDTTGYDVGIAGQHPFALDGDPGVAADTASTFVVSMGVLDQTGTQAGFSSTSDVLIATVEVGACFITVTEDALRGGIVGDAALTVNMPAADFEVTDGPMSCWDYPCFANGDANGDCAITFGDLSAVINAWAPLPYAECADFNKDLAITFGDLSVIINHWAPLPGCDVSCVPQ